jgi:hypothetical protein
MKKLFTLILIALFALPTMNALAQNPPPMPAKEKKLTLTVLLQSLYNGVDMSKAQDYVGGVPVDKFQGTVAEVITVELHDAVTYATIVYSTTADLNTDGTAVTSGKTYISIPSSYTGSYYITVKHRNSIETTSINPVSFTTPTINYNFTTAAGQAYGDNLMLLNPGGSPLVYGIFAGDVDQDGYVVIGDRDIVHNSAVAGTTGYVAEDVNGDGFVVIGDRDIVHINAVAGVTAVLP